MATIKPDPHFAVVDACKKLRAAMKGVGTNENQVIEVLTSHSNRQRQEIREKFKSMYRKPLREVIISELTGKLETAAVALLYTPEEYMARQLRKALQGTGTREDVLIEILCTRRYVEIDAIKTAYRNVFDRELSLDIQSETSDRFRRLLICQVEGSRDRSAEGDCVQAYRDVRELQQKGLEACFNAIMCERSLYQLRQTFALYKEMTGRDIEGDTKKAQINKDLKAGFLAIVESIRSRPHYYTTRLNRALKGLRTDDETIIRILVSRSEIDLADIKRMYLKEHEISLAGKINDQTSGHYRDLLLRIVGLDE